MPVLTVDARPKNLRRLRKFVAEGARQAGFDRRGVYAVQLAVDEAASNVIEHGYPDDQPGSITCEWTLTAEALVIRILDQGRFFDVTAAPAPDVVADLFERQAGGLGIHLMRQMVDEVHYRREDAGNVLTLIKYRKERAD